MSGSPIENIYREHHASGRRDGFSILEDERADIFAGAIGTSKRVLDIGCRDGTLTRHFVQGNDIVGVDIDTRLLAKARKDLGIETRSFDLNGDWQEFSGERFDVVVAGEIMEHLYHPGKVAARVASVLAPGGMFIGSVPNAFSLKNRVRLFFARKRHTPLADPTHISHFHCGELETLLRVHFSSVHIIGLGRYRTLARSAPGLFAFDLVFIASL